MTRSRLFPLVLITAVFVAMGGIVAIHRTSEPAQAVADTPLLAGTVPPEPTTTTTTTAAVPADPALVAAPKPANPTGGGGARRPVAVPANPRAPEPIQLIGTIEIPKIGLSHPIYHGITMRNIDLGPSHWPGTAFPGENGNAVFAGHRVTRTRPFRNIDQLVPGDKVFFTVNGVRSTYVVTGHEVVPPTAMRIVEQTPTPTATLFACHPPGSAKFRYVVHLALAAE